MILVEALPTAPPPPDSRVDALVLTWEDRARTRQKAITAGGREIAIKLPTATRLPPGAIVHIGAGFHVTVEAAVEDVWVVHSHHADTLMRVAYEIGNRHFPICIGEDSIAVLYDHTLAELWDRLGVQAERSRQPFLSEQRPSHHH